MRRIDLGISALLVPLDFVALLGAAVTAYALRFSPAFTAVRPILTDIPFKDFLSNAVLFAGIWILLFAIAGLYALKPTHLSREYSRILLASTAGIMIVIATVFFRRDLTASRFIVSALWALAILYVACGRTLLRIVRYALLRSRIGHERVILIGKGKTAEDLRRLYFERPTLGLTVIKSIPTWGETAERDVRAQAQKNNIQGIILADPDITRDKVLDLIAFAEHEHLSFHYLADPFTATFSRVEMTAQGGIPMLEVQRTPLEGWGRIVKRLFDVIVSALLLIIFSPVMAVTALAIVLDTHGGILFSRLPNGEKTTRMGQRGKPFHYFKFRSMRAGQHFMRYDALAHLDVRTGPLVKLKDDPRVTRVGKFIRKWSIDELPELLLVFLGRMSLVGPRPHLPEEVANYKPHHRRVLTIKPGITGMAQISGRSDLNFEDEVRLDTWYVEHWSLWLDLAILFKTPWAVVSHRGIEENV